MAMEDCCSEDVPQDQARSSLPRHSVSILEALKVPKASDLKRKRKVENRNLSVMRVVRNLVYGETLWQIILGPTSISPARKSLL